MAQPPCLGRRELTVQASRPDRRRGQDRESSPLYIRAGRLRVGRRAAGSGHVAADTAAGAIFTAPGKGGCPQGCDEVRAAQIFVPALAASNYTYAEATWTQTLPDWIGSHVRALAFLG